MQVTHFDMVTLFYIYMCNSRVEGEGGVTMKQGRKTAVVVITGEETKLKSLLSKI